MGTNKSVTCSWQRLLHEDVHPLLEIGRELEYSFAESGKNVAVAEASHPRKLVRVDGAILQTSAVIKVGPKVYVVRTLPLEHVSEVYQVKVTVAKENSIVDHVDDL